MVLTLIESAVDVNNNKLRDALNVSASYTTGVTNGGIDDVKISDYVMFENWKKE